VHGPPRVREVQDVLPLRLLRLLLLRARRPGRRSVQPVLEPPLAERARLELVLQALREGGERGRGRGAGGDAVGGRVAGEEYPGAGSVVGLGAGGGGPTLWLYPLLILK
jgi:hypothetical protein